MSRPKVSRFLLRGDLKSIKAGKFWVCVDNKHIQPKGRLNCVDCSIEGEKNG